MPKKQINPSIPDFFFLPCHRLSSLLHCTTLIADNTKAIVHVGTSTIILQMSWELMHRYLQLINQSQLLK